MEVILCQDVVSLGKIGDVVKVKDGFARNFLFPEKKAYVATPENKRRIAAERARLQAEYDKGVKEAEALAEKLSKVSCTVTVEVNDKEKLYGAVSEIDIVKALEVEGFTIDKKDIVLDKPVEELGIFDVGVKLHPKVMAKIRLWVAKK
jgi:large subunit ribosomal protein L9